MRHELSIKICMVVLFSFMFTIFWLLVFYMRWDFIGVSISLAVMDFNKWPWFIGSAVLSGLTFFIPFFAFWSGRGNPKIMMQEIAAYGFGLLWVPLLIMYPGEDLSSYGDDNLIFALFPICVIHYFCGKYIGLEIVAIKEIEDGVS